MWCTLVSPWILNGINISNANYTPTSSFMFLTDTRGLENVSLISVRGSGGGAEFQLHKSHPSLIAKGLTADTTVLM